MGAKGLSGVRVVGVMVALAEERTVGLVGGVGAVRRGHGYARREAGVMNAVG